MKNFSILLLLFSLNFTSNAATRTELESPRSPRGILRLKAGLPVKTAEEASTALDTKAKLTVNVPSELASLIDRLRASISPEVLSYEADVLKAWIKDNIAKPIEGALLAKPAIMALLKNAIVLQRPYILEREPASDNPLLWMIDRWPDQTWEDAIVGGILNPSPIPTFRTSHADDAGTVIRFAGATIYKDPSAIHRIASWARAHAPAPSSSESEGEDEGDKDRKVGKKSKREELDARATDIFTTQARRQIKTTLSSHQKAMLEKGMRDLGESLEDDKALAGAGGGGADSSASKRRRKDVAAEESKGELAAFEDDPRLLLANGLKAGDTNILKRAFDKGHLLAGIHETRYVKEKPKRKERLETLRAMLEGLPKPDAAVDLTQIRVAKDFITEDLRKVEGLKPTASSGEAIPAAGAGDEEEVSEALAEKLLAFLPKKGKGR